MNPSDQARDLLNAPPTLWSFADWSDAAVAVVFVAAMIFGAGWWTRGWSDSSEAERIAAAPKPVVERQNPPESLIPCTKEGFAEYRRICWHRAQSALVTPKE